MTYTSFVFFIFLAAVALLYFLVPLKCRWVILLTASLCFYISFGLKYLPFLIGAAAVSFWGARLICALNRKTDGMRIRRILVISLIILIGYLALTKAVRYVDPGSGIIVPVGLSYYTFSVTGYLLDIYWKRYEPERNFLLFLLYVSYFPHILQGPIPRYDRLGPQLHEGHPFEYRRVCFGAQLMLFGLFQKLVLADRLKLFVDAAFEQYSTQYGLVAAAAVVLYAIQIYTDFAGCVNIARGMSQIFGVTLEENFRQPYFSISVEEFWRRWHMTLGGWFRDYVGMPVSVSKAVKKRSKEVRKRKGNAAGRNVVSLSALAVVWLATGLWHGTGLNYVIWALWQGGIIAIGTVNKDRFRSWKKALRIPEGSKAFHLFRMARTFLLAGLIPRIITRAPSLYAALILMRNLFLGTGLSELRQAGLASYGWNRWHLAIASAAILIQFGVSLLKERGVKIRERIADMPLPLRWGIYLGGLYFVVIFGLYGPGYNAKNFVYMDF